LGRLRRACGFKAKHRIHRGQTISDHMVPEGLLCSQKSQTKTPLWLRSTRKTQQPKMYTLSIALKTPNLMVTPKDVIWSEMSGAETTSNRIIKLGDKEIEINQELYRIVQDYIKNSYTLDTLAEKLGLDGWSEAYQFVASLPQWVVWFTESQLEEYLSQPHQERQQQAGAPKRTTRRRKEQSEATQAEDKNVTADKEEKQ